MTHWYPDTCGCKIVIDDTGPTRGQATQHLVQCAFHKNTDHLGVLAENRMKNYALNAVAKADPTLVDKDGNYLHTFAMSGSDAQRTVQVILPAGADTAKAQAALAAEPKLTKPVTVTTAAIVASPAIALKGKAG